MSQYRVRTTDDLLTVEASSYVQDSNGLKLYNAAGEFLAQFNSFLSVVRVDAIVDTDSTATETTTDTATETTETPAASVETPTVTGE
ncbi:hypothetical protein [Pseudomonas typographi]|uniref:Uncharacterized protein n=1 Tax=Pseudomonas typographi TaxID=2715964 RepID=A0ABR7Z8V5_9PSED|nr:hypothetical protein [Pseudomonas typographi]MBD1601975.1 hypothetical protein [Pseudomonas typographi]